MSPSSSIRDFAQYIGRFVWPRSAADLTDTTLCPACLTELPAAVCSNCGLDLRHPAARELLTASTDAAAALDKRVQLIGRIRFETAEAAQAAADGQARRQAAEHAAAHAAEAAERAAAERADLARVHAQRAADVEAAHAVQAAAHARAQAAASTSTSAAPPATTVAATTGATPTGAAPTVAAPAAAAPTTAPATPTGNAPTAPASAAPTPHKRSSVQVVLLLVGVTLVSVAAIVFLTVAFVVAGLAVRSAIVGLFTLAMLATAGLLRKKNLVSTAEGIGALAVVLVLLDAWALRQNNLFGFGDADGLLFWGGTLAVCTGLFLLWHAVSSLRVASVAGFAAAAPAVGLISAGLAADAEPTTRLFLAAAGVAAGALLHRFTRPGTAAFWPTVHRRAERVALLALAGLGLVTATLIAGFVAPQATEAPLLTFGAVTVLALAHVLVAVAGRGPDAAYRAFAAASAGLAAAALVLGTGLFAWRTENTNLLVTLPLLVAAALALSLELAWRRRTAGPARTAILTAALTAASFVTMIGGLVFTVTAVPLASTLVTVIARTDGPVALVSELSSWALAALVGVAVLVAGFWRAGAVLRPRLRVLAWFGVIVVLLAVPFTQWLWLVLPLYLVLGAAALTVLLLARTRALPIDGHRPALVALFIAAEALGYSIGWASSTSWWVGTLSAVVAVFVARFLLHRQAQATGRGVLLAGAMVLTLIGVAAAPEALTLAAPPTAAVLWLQVCVALVLVTGLLQVLVAQGRIGRFTDTERRWGFWTLLAPTVLGIVLPTGRLIDGLSISERATIPRGLPLAGIAATVLLGTAALLWTLAPGTGLRRERFTGALLVAPVVLALTVNLISLTGASATVSVLAAPIAALVTVALALVLRVVVRRDVPTTDFTSGGSADGSTGGAIASTAAARSSAGLEIGAAVVLASVLLLPGLTGLGWLVLLLTAVALLLTAIDADGLFASGSWRRHVGWLAVAAATAALWWGLVRAGTTPVEAYVLPPAGLLLLLAALLWRYGRVDRAVAASPGAALLTLAGLSVALLPLALSMQAGSVVRPVIVGAASAVLLISATLVRWTPPRSAYLAAAGLAGALGLLCTGIARSLRVVNGTGSAGPQLEAWLLPTVVITATAAFLLVRQTDAGTRQARNRASVALLIVALGTLTGLEVAALDTSALAAGRAIGLVVLLAAGHVLALWRTRVPLGAVVAWTSAVLAGFAAGAALAAGAVDPFDVVTVPVGLALVTAQLVTARPWAGAAALPSGPSGAVVQGWLAVGLAIALLPSAIEGEQGSLLRPVLVLAVGGLLTVGGALLIARSRWQVVAWPSVLVGAVAVSVVAAGRIRELLDGPTSADWRLETWLLPAALLLIGAGWVVITRSPAGASVAPGAVGRIADADAGAAANPAADAGAAAAAAAAAAANPGAGAAGAAAAAATATAPVNPGGSAAALSAVGPRSVLGYGLVIAALAGILGAEVAALPASASAYAEGRVIALIGLFAVLQVAVRWVDRSRAGRLLTWLLVTAGFLVLIAALGRDLLAPVELGTVPLGLALVAGQLIAARVIGRSRENAAPAPAPRAVQVGLAVGLAVALEPSAVLGAEGTVLRAVVSLSIGGALGILGALLVTRARWTVLAWPACLVGTFTILVAASLRLAAMPGPPAGPNGQLETWLLPAVGLLVIIGTCLVWVARSADSADARSLPLRGGYALVAAALLGTALAEMVALGYAPLATVRVVLVVWVFSAVFLAAFWGDRSPLGRLIAWVALASAGGMLAAGLMQDVPDPVEIVTVPLALALIAAGLAHLKRVPRAGSWPALAPGLLLLLAPSMLLDLSFSPLWRVVGLGLVAIAVLLLGTARRLQAPFVIAATVLLVHALAQLWPWIALLYVSVQWWLWLGIGGVLLIVLAARYEQRIQNLKSVALKISALR